MFAVITVIHVLACIFLILVVLLQTGKGAEMGAVFGGSSSTVFGSSGAGNFLTRLTTATAVIFMVTSMGLTYFSARQNTSTILDTAPAASVPAVDEIPAPGAPLPDAAPAPEAAAPIEAPVADAAAAGDAAAPAAEAAAEAVADPVVDAAAEVEVPAAPAAEQPAAPADAAPAP